MSDTMTATHTPGPWRFDSLGDGRVLSDRLCIALVMRGVDEYSDEHLGGPTFQANANLIAAAPDLLASLKSLTGWLGGQCVEGDTIGSLKRMLADAQRSIAKAEGQS